MSWRWPWYILEMVRICPGCGQGVDRIWPCCGQSVSRMWSVCGLDEAMIWPRYGHGMTSSWPRCVHDIDRRWTWWAHDVTRIWQWYEQDVTNMWQGVTRVWLGYDQDVARMLWGYGLGVAMMWPGYEGCGHDMVMMWPSCGQDVARSWLGYGYIVTRVWVTIMPNEYRSYNIIVTIIATDRVMLHFHLKQNGRTLSLMFGAQNVFSTQYPIEYTMYQSQSYCLYRGFDSRGIALSHLHMASAGLLVLPGSTYTSYFRCFVFVSSCVQCIQDTF